MRVVVLDDWNRVWDAAPEIARLRRRAEVVVSADVISSRDELINRLQGVDVVVPNRGRTTFDAEFFAGVPGLKMIAQTGGGIGHVDQEAATRNGTLISVTLGGSPGGMIEFTIGSIIGAMRRTAEQDRAIRCGVWSPIVGQELNGKTLGIIGLGRIGKGVAKVALVLGMRVIAAGLTLTLERAQESGVEFRTIDELMAESDVVSVHFQLSDRTRGIISRERIAKMKPSAVLVNTSRGPIVDQDALADALLNGRIAGAALDVFDQEPLPPSHKLLGCQTAFLTAHCGWVTQTAYQQFFEGVEANIEAFLDGKPQNLKNPEALRSATA